MTNTTASKPMISGEIPAANSTLLSWLGEAGFFLICAKNKYKVYFTGINVFLNDLVNSYWVSVSW